MTKHGRAQRILVTGGAGFLGGHLCARLLAGGHQVVCLDDFSTGRRENIAPFAGDARFELIEHDVTRPFDVAADAIYNLACPASPVHYQSDPIQTLKTSVLGAINVLELARRSGAMVLQTSTSEIYGDPAVHPQPETYWGNVNPIGIRACYDEGKRAAETLFFDYHRQHGVRIKLVRIANTYGPGMRDDDGRVISNFIVQALRGDDITVFGAGGQTRSFCYVDDMIDGLVRMMASEEAVIGPVNLCNPSEISVSRLAETIVALTGSTSRIVTSALPVDDPQRRSLDISLAQALLGWQPTIGLDMGLRATIAYFREMLGQGGSAPASPNAARREPSPPLGENK